MKTTTFNIFFAIVISGLVLTSCSKTDLTEFKATPNAATTANTNNAVATVNTNNEGKPAPTTASILNQDLRISYARDNGVDITSQFLGFTFLFDGVYPSGKAFVWNDQAQTGTWSSPLEATDLVLWYPTEIFAQLAFLNREWNIAEASTTFYRLEAADGDVMNFVSTK